MPPGQARKLARGERWRERHTAIAIRTSGFRTSVRRRYDLNHALPLLLQQRLPLCRSIRAPMLVRASAPYHTATAASTATIAHDPERAGIGRAARASRRGRGYAAFVAFRHGRSEMAAARASGSAKQGVTGLAEFTLPKNSKITKGREWKPEEGKRLQDLQDLPLRPGQRRQSALRPLHHRSRQVRADGPRRADQDQERDRPDADLPPLVPRGHLRVVRDEHGRPQRPRLHDRDRGSEGRRPDHAAAAHGSGQGPRPRPHPCLRAICARSSRG